MLGDKNRARSLARAADVPVVPGSDGLIEEESEAVRVAHEIGFPVLIKATAGGGGKGMRVAANDLALKSALQQARKEAEAAFGNAGVYLEKYVENGHVMSRCKSSPTITVTPSTCGNAIARPRDDIRS